MRLGVTTRQEEQSMVSINSSGAARVVDKRDGKSTIGARARRRRGAAYEVGILRGIRLGPFRGPIFRHGEREREKRGKKECERRERERVEVGRQTEETGAVEVRGKAAPGFPSLTTSFCEVRL